MKSLYTIRFGVKDSNLEVIFDDRFEDVESDDFLSTITDAFVIATHRAMEDTENHIFMQVAERRVEE